MAILLGLEIVAVVGILAVAWDRAGLRALVALTCGLMGWPFRRLTDGHEVSMSASVPIAVVGGVAGLLLWRSVLRARSSD